MLYYNIMKPDSVPFSLLNASLLQRLLIAGAAAALLWLAIGWAWA